MEEHRLAERDPIREFAIRLARSCHDDRCSDVVILDLRGLSSVTDFFVIATGSSDRQIRTTADHLRELAKADGWRHLGLEGYRYAHWILIDFLDVMVHVFDPEFRQIYDLELLWGDAPRIDWQRQAREER